MNKIIVITIIAICVHLSGATMCKPGSTFKIDCNMCFCSNNGREYTCTTDICPPREDDYFIKEHRKDGYVLLRPRPKYEKFDDDDDDFVLTKRLRRAKIPYVQDEIPPSREDIDDMVEVSNSDDEDVETLDDSNYDFIKNIMDEPLK